MEQKTIKTTAAALGIADASVRRTLKRWIEDAEKSRLFTNPQRSFIQSIKAETVWPDWLDSIWCENYQPRVKDARAVEIGPSGIDAKTAAGLLDNTREVFADNALEALKKERDDLAAKLELLAKRTASYEKVTASYEAANNQLATKLELSDNTLTRYEAEIEALRDQVEEWEKMANTDRAKYIQTHKDLQGLERELADVNAKIAELNSERNQTGRVLSEKSAKIAEWAAVIQDQHETINNLQDAITNLTHERNQEAESAKEAFAAWQEATAKLEVYEADTWRKRIADAVRYAFSDYLIPKFALLAFQSYIYALYSMRLFAFINTQLDSRTDISKTYTDDIIHQPWLYAMWALGFFVDSAGFAIAAKLSEPKYLSDGDPRLTWIGWFLVLQLLIVICYLFGAFSTYMEWVGAIIIHAAPVVGLNAYYRATFKKGQP